MGTGVGSNNNNTTPFNIRQNASSFNFSQTFDWPRDRTFSLAGSFYTYSNILCLMFLYLIGEPGETMMSSNGISHVNTVVTMLIILWCPIMSI